MIDFETDPNGFPETVSQKTKWIQENFQLNHLQIEGIEKYLGWILFKYPGFDLKKVLN
jgi:hypothetical protein